MENKKWEQSDLEYDLKNSPWMVEKVRNCEIYSQNLYAAMCNNQFIKNTTWDILKDDLYSVSWRYAGGIVAEIRGEGDYIDWYCSGIQTDEERREVNLTNNDNTVIMRTQVGESVVTDEIREDLLKLGWLVCPDDDDE
jgi:hypothetical protein